MLSPRLYSLVEALRVSSTALAAFSSLKHVIACYLPFTQGFQFVKLVLL